MEAIQNGRERAAALVEYLQRLYEGPVTKEVYQGYEHVLADATAFEENAALDEVLSKASDIEAWKTPVARFIRSASRGLEAEALPEYPQGSLFARLETENKKIEEELSALQEHIRRCRGDSSLIAALLRRIGGFAILEDHYRSLQYELFPLFESADPRHACVSLMWALQNDALRLRSILAEIPEKADPDLWDKVGAFYMTVGMLLYRERRILYPVAYRAIPERLWGQGRQEGHASGGVFACPTGSLEFRELEAILKLLPVDFSLIGPDDRVKFYSDPPHRIFPRTPAVIGRKVQNCHPPKSVAMVEEILSSFKNGSREKAEFWLESKGAFIHIQYFALRDAKGAYMGTLEVSQDATALRALTGEKRLL
jgi:hypothetical protein